MSNPGLPQVRRMEAVSFRSFPATSSHFDGTWVIRLTAGLPAKRLNSVNPLDPSDHADIEKRVELAQRKFESFGRPLIFRMSPLSPPQLNDVLDQRGWSRFEESLVMVVNLDAIDLDDAIDQVPTRDTGIWVDTFLDLSGEPADHKPGLSEVIGAIQPKTGLFMTKNEQNESVSAVRCVCDNDLVGLFDLVTGGDRRRQGHGQSLIKSALKWAKSNGAKVAWLQVVAENRAAIALYQSLGFAELYRYNYRSAPDQASE